MDKSGHVYLFRCGEYYKIGVTEQSIESRLKAVRQKYRPLKVSFVHALVSDSLYAAEKFFHLKFGDKRIKNELFDLTSDDIAWFMRVHSCSREYLKTKDISQSKPPATEAREERACRSCGATFVTDIQKAPRRIYCSEVCGARMYGKLYNEKHPTAKRYIPRPRLGLQVFLNCAVCGASLPLGFGPCCSQQCAMKYSAGHAHQP